MKFGGTVLHVGGVGFSLQRHNFKMAAMTSFHTEKCSHLTSKHEASVARLCSSVGKFLLYSIFVLVVIIKNNTTLCGNKQLRFT